MSAIITGRVFWTPMKELSYVAKNGKVIKVAETSAKIVLLAIADNSDDYGENSWQSFDTLAQKTGLQRRSVIRVVRALCVHGYTLLVGVSQFGTNNYKVNTTKLGVLPPKRAKAGRPKTSDSSAETGDSESETGDSSAETGDSESPYPSLPIPKPPSNQNPPPVEEKPASGKKPDLVDGMLAYAQSPGIKREGRVAAILSSLGEAFGLNVCGKRWEAFARFVDDRQEHEGERLERFVSWLKGRKDFDVTYWPPSRMREFWPQAFQAQEATPPPEEENPFTAEEIENIAAYNRRLMAERTEV